MHITILRLAASLALISAITLVYFTTQIANTLTVALSYLLAVLALAATWGLIEAIVASLISTFALNYFFMPPHGTLTIADLLGSLSWEDRSPCSSVTLRTMSSWAKGSRRNNFTFCCMPPGPLTA